MSTTSNLRLAPAPPWRAQQRTPCLAKKKKRFVCSDGFSFWRAHDSVSSFVDPAVYNAKNDNGERTTSSLGILQPTATIKRFVFSWFYDIFLHTGVLYTISVQKLHVQNRHKKSKFVGKNEYFNFFDNWTNVFWTSVHVGCEEWSFLGLEKIEDFYGTSCFTS